MNTPDVATAIGATITGMILGYTAKRWLPHLERLEGKATQTVEGWHRRRALAYDQGHRRFDPLVRDRLRS